MSLSRCLRQPEAYNCLTSIIKDVNREVVSIQKDKKSAAVHMMDEVVDYVIMRLKDVDETFDQVYSDKRRVGSFFDGLRVTEPTEFDVNIVLDFPFHRICTVESSHPGYVRVRVKSLSELKRERKQGRPIEQLDPKLAQMIDKRGYILRNKVLSWWQSIFARALPSQNITFFHKRYLIRWTTSGPAVTLHVTCQDHPKLEMDIDLVPVMMFDNETARSPPTPLYQSRRAKIPNLPSEWYIVPKPIRNDDTERRWRLSFTDQEKVIMRGREQLKPMNRLMKRLRDKNGWKPLNSYMIKNVFLHETENPIYAVQNIGYLFVHALTTLKHHMSRKNLPYYWHGKRNMFINMEMSTAQNIAGSINNILKKIDSRLNSPEEMEEYVRSIFV